MTKNMPQAVIVAAARTAVGKAPKGSLRQTRPDDLGALVVGAALSRVPQLEHADIEDILFGCAFPEAEQGQNVARLISFRAGLPDSIPAMTINRFCASGLQTIMLAADRIRAGGGNVFVAGGTESMSMIPLGGGKIAPNPWLLQHRPGSYMSMGLTAERVAARYNITREDADNFAMDSNHKAAAAIAAGRFDAEIVTVPAELTTTAEDGTEATQQILFCVDEGPRAKTSMIALAGLRAVFDERGVVTAGNSSQMSDGAAAVVVMSESRAAELGATPLLRCVSYSVAGCAPEEMGIGPIYAVPKALAAAGLCLSDIDLIELNEAFATQAVAVIRTLGIDPAKINVNGGAIALGHPMGCTGTKLTVSLAAEMKRRGSRYGMVTMCVGGGQGVAAIFENLQEGPVH